MGEEHTRTHAGSPRQGARNQAGKGATRAFPFPAKPGCACLALVALVRPGGRCPQDHSPKSPPSKNAGTSPPTSLPPLSFALLSTTQNHHTNPNTTQIRAYTSLQQQQPFQPLPNQSSEPSKCLRPQLSVVPARRRPRGPRRTPTPPSAVSPPTCSLPTSSARTFVRRTPAFLSARSASSSVSAGRPSTRSSVAPTRQRLSPIRSVMRTRRRRTTPRLRTTSLLKTLAVFELHHSLSLYRVLLDSGAAV